MLSVDAVKMFKPRPEVYALVTPHFSVKPAEVVFVSSNRWDAMGATAFGFRTVWVNRAKAPDEYHDLPPAAVVPDLTGLLVARRADGWLFREVALAGPGCDCHSSHQKPHFEQPPSDSPSASNARQNGQSLEHVRLMMPDPTSIERQNR